MKNFLLKGLAVSKGKVQGRVRIVKGIEDSHSFQEGDILVTKITDPTMVMMMSKSAAIVCDVGGMTSHPSIVSREMGIPCVVNTKEASSKLKDGMMVLVDGGKGEVYELLDREKSKDKEIDEYLDVMADACVQMDYVTFDDTVSWFAYDPLIAKSWTKRILKMINDCHKSDLSHKDIGLLFPSISQLRNMMLFDLWIANYAEPSSEEYMKIFDYYNEVLQNTCLDDHHAVNMKNIIHNQEQRNKLLSGAKPADELIAKRLGKISNVCYHFSHAAYADMNPAICYENYGPYDVSDRYGPGHVVMIKEFNNLRCPDLWSETEDTTINQVHIVAVYKDVGVTVDNISHINYKGDIIGGLKYYRLLIDGKNYPIEDDGFLETIGSKAISLFQNFQALNFEDRKKMFYHQKAYVYRRLYEKLGQDWKPSNEILNEAKGKKLFEVNWPKSRDGRWKLTRNIADPRIFVKKKIKNTP